MFKCYVLATLKHELLRKMSILTQKLNPITGQCDWEVQSEYYDYHQEIARSAYADMLHDDERNKKYYEALKIAVNMMHKGGKRALVLDIGTGTGLLSMMAVKCGADSVVACEAFKPMSACAQKIIDLNGFSDKIKLIPKRSTDLVVGEDLNERANILITEVFDTELIGEGAIGTFSHAHKELLEKDCYVIPNSANVYAQVVESPLAANWNKLKDIFNSNGEKLLLIPNSVRNCPGAAAVHDIQLSQFPSEFINSIISPQIVMRFDFSGKTPLNFDRMNILSCRSQRDGVAQVVFMWWELFMDPNNKILLSCAPYWEHPLVKQLGKNNVKIPWRDHWMQAVYYLPAEVPVKKDEELYLISCHDEYSLWFNLKKDLNLCEQDYRHPLCDCDVHIAFSRTRIGQLNDGVRVKKYVSALERYVTKDSVVLILSHGFYLGLIASKLGAKKVYYLESNIHVQRIISSFAEYNGFKNVEVLDNVEELKKCMNNNEISLVFGEPNFLTTIVPWDNLYFCYLLEQVKEMLSNDVRVIPIKADINILAVQFIDLYKIRAPITVCEGFDMKPFDELIMNSCKISDSDVEAQPLWEYPGIALSNVKTVATMELQHLFKRDIIHDQGVIKLECDKDCNGVAVWIDWYLDESPKNKISTGPIIPPTIGEKIKWDMHTRQGVSLLLNKEGVRQLKYDFKFNIDKGEISFKIQ